MPGRYRKSQSKNRSRFFILLSVVFIIVMFKWGIPLFVNLIAGKGVERVNMENDIIPPQSPIISALPDATNSGRVLVEGFTEAGASVELLLNDKTDKISFADDFGSFSFYASLTSGLNRIQLKAKDEKGNESMSKVSLVIYDSKPIDLLILSPKDGTEYYGRINQVIDIKGEVDKVESSVLINNSFVSVDGDGVFVHRFSLSDGENIITVVASDAAGNTAQKSLRLIYTP